MLWCAGAIVESVSRSRIAKAKDVGNVRVM
jgi:hypothetical protein